MSPDNITDFNPQIAIPHVFYIGLFKDANFRISNTINMKKDYGSSTKINFETLFDMEKINNIRYSYIVSILTPLTDLIKYINKCTSDQIKVTLYNFLIEAVKIFENDEYGAKYKICTDISNDKLYFFIMGLVNQLKTNIILNIILNK